MVHPYHVTADDAATSYHRTAESAEGAVIKSLRAGARVVRATYLRHPVLTFTVDPTFIGDDGEQVMLYPSWFVLTGEAAYHARQASPDPTQRVVPPSILLRGCVERLGNITPMPKGKIRQLSVTTIMARTGLSVAKATEMLDVLDRYRREGR